MPDDLGISLRSRSAPPPADDIDVALRDTAVLYDGRRISVPESGLTIGRDPGNALQLVSGLVSPHHARIEVEHGEHYVTDLGSTTGTFLNGERFGGGRRRLRAGDTLAMGDDILRFVTTREATFAPIELPPPDAGRRALRLDRPKMVIGSAPGSDVVLEHPTVSPAHAEIAAVDGGTRLQDVSHGSTGVRVNGVLISRAFLKTGDEIGIGPYRLIYDGQALVRRAELQGLRLDCEGVSFEAGGRTILHNAWLRVRPGELVAIIGESGAGKSTLVKCLAGVTRPAAGRVTVNGEALMSRLADVGYVPQDDIVHRALTVREALTFAAELRLPQDATSEDHAAAAARAMADVGLTERADTLVGSLSGGQRKRVGVAAELVDRPGLLFLDEPTTGLDPGLEFRMMELLRELADSGLGVALVTHATKNLRMADKVVVMGRGGILCFAGPYAEALAFFGVEEPDDIYVALDGTDPADWNARYLVSESATTEWANRTAPAPVAQQLAPPRRVGPQVRTLARRYGRIFFRDRRNLTILAAQVPLLGLGTGLLYKSGVFAQPPETPHAGEAAQLLFLLVTISIWFGAITAAREIVKERAVLDRELAIGVRPQSYLLSKLVLLCTVTGVQTLVFAFIVFTLRPLSEPGGVYQTIVVLLLVTTWAAVTMGLVASTFAASEDQASSSIPLILVPQLLFGGAIVPVEQMGQPIKLLSALIFAQWSFGGIGHAVDMKARIAADPVFSPASRYGPGFFEHPAVLSLFVLALFVTGFLFLTLRRLMAAADPNRP